MLKRVAITVVEGDADEAAAEIALGHAAVHLVEADGVNVRSAQQLDHAAEKPRRDFEDAIGLEAIGPRRADVMQRQDRADAADERVQRQMRAGKVRRNSNPPRMIVCLSPAIVSCLVRYPSALAAHYPNIWLIILCTIAHRA